MPRDEQAALRALRASHVPSLGWLLGLMFVVVGTLMLVFQRFVGGETWASAAPFSTIWAACFVLLWGWGERRRRRRRRHVADATHLERGVVTAREGRQVTVRGDEHVVSWRTETAFGLAEGDPVWAAPRIAPGERIVLVRPRSTHGLLQDVIGPRTDAVVPGSAPARDVDASGRGHTP